jgi:hypothetical protein
VVVSDRAGSLAELVASPDRVASDLVELADLVASVASVDRVALVDLAASEAPAERVALVARVDPVVLVARVGLVDPAGLEDLVDPVVLVVPVEVHFVGTGSLTRARSSATT